MKITVLKVAIEAQFEPSLTYYSKQGEIGNKIWNRVYPYWETDGKRVIFKNLEDREICLVEFRRVLVVKEYIQNYSSKKVPFENFSKVFTAYIGNLINSKLLRVGLRIIGFYDPKLKFNEIATVMKPKIYPANDSNLYEITSTTFKDVSFAAVYEKQKKLIRFQSGPVLRDELLARSQLTFPLLEKYEIPDTSLFIDVDIFKEKPNKKYVDKFITESLSILNEDIDSFLHYILKD